MSLEQLRIKIRTRERVRAYGSFSARLLLALAVVRGPLLLVSDEPELRRSQGLVVCWQGA